MDSFNIPSYAATLEQFREAVNADGSFAVNQLEHVMGSRLAVDDDPHDRRAVGRRVANNQRSIFRTLVEAHIGRGLVDELFVRRDLVDAGLIDGGSMDSFNIPSYAATLEEFREAVKADGSFAVNQLEHVMGSRLAMDDDPHDRRAVGRRVANNQRSIFRPLVEVHIGRALADELFVRMERRAGELAEELGDEMGVHFHIVCSLSLV
uniref:Uncharacterized protein n=1 Tax=Oryza rufipogon TaxID=4529 RepID=A0A0E0PX48_ORYRU